ncbi:MAG: hypothetical protein IT356_07045 [Gemmatimonadaceae bacterium]|nr:hypothetical protein [Gemmatimonadaceae bacterium]
MSRRGAGKEVLGVSLAPGNVVAAADGVRTVWERAVEFNGGANGTREALGAALSDAARESGLSAPTIAIALMPPLAETRTIALPPLRESDRNRFLQRNAQRYFVGARGAQVVGSALAGAPAKGGGVADVLASAVAQQFVEAVHDASEIAGSELRALVPAEAAWAAAAVAMWPALARGSAHMAVAGDDRAELLALSDGVLTGVRRFRGAADAGEMARVVSGPVGVVGTSAAASALAEALSGVGARVVRPDAAWAALAERPDALAARFAPRAAGLVIRSERARELGQAAVTRASWSLIGAAAAVLVVAALVHFRGVQRELASVQAARAAIRPQVEASLVGRSSVDAAYRQVAALAAASRAAPRWSVVLAGITDQLSDDASISAFRARGDSIFIDGAAAQAAPVFDEIARVPGVTGVRATAPVRRESIEGQPPVERFSLGAQLGGARK